MTSFAESMGDNDFKKGYKKNLLSKHRKGEKF